MLEDKEIESNFNFDNMLGIVFLFLNRKLLLILLLV